MSSENDGFYAIIIVMCIWAICANWGCFIRNLIYCLYDYPKSLCCKKKKNTIHTTISVPV